MLIKSYEILKKDLNFLNSFLIYGENTGLKQDIVKSVINLKEKKNIKYKQFKFEEEEIIKNQIIPLIEEYYFDKPDIIEEISEDLIS